MKIETFAVKIDTLSTSINCSTKPDVMLVLDKSLSIDAIDLGKLKTAALDFVTNLSPAPNGTHVGQVSFATNGFLDLHLSSNISDINYAINHLSTPTNPNDGYTNLAAGINKATAEFANTSYDRNDTESPDSMIIITDGIPTAVDATNKGNDITHIRLARNAALASANAADTAGIKIYVVGVGIDDTMCISIDGETCNDWLRDNIATNASYYFTASDWNVLQSILRSLSLCHL
jgi:Mg-chelatase subunit ChlD